MGRVISRRNTQRSRMFRLALIATLVAVAFGWQNSWDGRHYMYCRNGQHIRRLQSIHDNHREDRLWQADCGDVAGVKADQACVWTGYVNGWDEMLTYSCPSGKVITGMDSIHNNGKEDRLFKFRCCALRRTYRSCPNGRFGSACQHTCRCWGNKACNKYTGACPYNKCAPGRTGAACQLDDRCYYGKREDYQGKKYTTVSGRRCQPWKSDKPHKHTYHMRCDFADGRVQKDAVNYCRTAVWETQYDPWCFTTDSRKRWEYCGVRKCSCPSGFFGKNCEKQCNCKYGNTDCNGITGSCRRGCAYGFSGAGCQTRIAAVPKNCYMTSWINGWDARMNYYVPSGWVLSGFFSVHDNGREDRIWKAVICSMNE